MSTDTAFALGLLALVARGLPDRVRIFLLTVVVVDDLVTLLVIATVNSGPVALRPLLLALGFFGSMLLLRLVRVRFGLLYFLLGVAAWVALQSSGIEPVVLGLAVGRLGCSSGVAGTPTFFINGRRQYGAYDIDTRTQRSRRQGSGKARRAG